MAIESALYYFREQTKHIRVTEKIKNADDVCKSYSHFFSLQAASNIMFHRLFFFSTSDTKEHKSIGHRYYICPYLCNYNLFNLIGFVHITF